MLGTDAEPGIMARTLNDLFFEMEKAKTENIYKVSLSYLEVNNWHFNYFCVFLKPENTIEIVFF